MLRKNFILTQDDRLQYGQSTFQGTFYDISQQQFYIDSATNYNYLKKHLFQVQIYIGSSSTSYKRKTYSLTDIARDVGGVVNVLLLFFSIVISPFASHSFLTKAISRLYYARTKDINLF